MRATPRRQQRSHLLTQTPFGAPRPDPNDEVPVWLTTCRHLDEIMPRVTSTPFAVPWFAQSVPPQVCRPRPSGGRRRSLVAPWRHSGIHRSHVFDCSQRNDSTAVQPPAPQRRRHSARVQLVQRRRRSTWPDTSAAARSACSGAGAQPFAASTADRTGSLATIAVEAGSIPSASGGAQRMRVAGR